MCSSSSVLVSTKTIPILESFDHTTKDDKMKNFRITGVIPTAIVASVFMLSFFTVGCVSDATNEESVPTSLLKAGATKNSPASVNLGMAGNYVILSKTGISTTGTTAVTGNIGASPVAATYITGFSLSAPPTTYSTSPLVIGKVFAANYDSPTPANLTSAVLDMQTAYNDAASRAPNVTELGAGNIGGMTLKPGVYKWSSNVLAPTNVTLNGSSTSIWIFEIAGNLTFSSGVKIILTGGALPKNIYWQVAGIAGLGTTSHIEGVVLSKTAIVLKTGASANGRLLAQTAVTLDANAVK